MAHELDLEVVAEGVETEAQLDYLRVHGCDSLQGFLFSRPVAASDLERLLDEPASASI
jgi:EAL domain-containing protein (putative c-di-GMP-specific phosphodiesterase class I)